MVIKPRILFGIEHLKQSRSGISSKIRTDFIDLVEQKERITDPCLFKIKKDLAGHGANIGSPVTADLGFVTDPAKRHLDKLARSCPGN